MHTRLKAFLIHLSASIGILGIFALVVLLWWYPAPMLSLQGGWEIWLMILAVDVILGPTLTGIVYKPGKKGLIVDLSIIVMFQLAALVFGAVSIHSQKPNYLAFVLDRFFIVSLTDTVGDLPANENFSIWKGSIRLVTMPTTPQTTAKSLDELSLDGVNLIPPLAIVAREARPYPNNGNEWLNNMTQKFDEIPNPNIQKLAKEKAKALNVSNNEIRVIPVIGRKQKGFALILRDTGQILDIVE